MFDINTCLYYITLNMWLQPTRTITLKTTLPRLTKIEIITNKKILTINVWLPA